MPELPETLRATLERLRGLTFAEAYERIVDGDPLRLASRAEAALARAAQWAPVEVVVLRAARHLASALRGAPQRDEAIDDWVDAHVARAVSEARDGARAAEPREHESWARHHGRVAAALGVHERLGRDALGLFDAYSLEERRLLLLGMRLAREHRTRDLDAVEWVRFNNLWRGLVKAVLNERTP
jgi:hypothetical protein